MATLDSYRRYVQDLMIERAGNVWDKRIIPETIFDRENDRYQLVYVGWQDERRVYGVVLHVDIIDGKIWVQQDGTEVGIANQLVELGVPKQDIVLGFDPPMMRDLTEFAVG